MLTVLDKCPTCGADRSRKAQPEKALISWSQMGNALILEYTKEGLLERAIQSTSEWADTILDMSEVPVPEEKLVIWEGTAVEAEAGEVTFKGKLRPLSTKEWTSLKDGLLLF